MSEVEHSTVDKTNCLDLGCAASDNENTNAKTSDVGTSGTRHAVTLVMLKSADGKSFNVEKNVARKLKFDDADIERAIEGDPILLDDIESDVLVIMIKWAEKHVNDQEADDDSEDDDDDDDEVKRSDDIDEWDNELLNVEIGTLFRLLTAAMCRDIKGLSKVSAKKSASQFQNKTIEQLWETVNSLKTVQKTDREN